jgi:hypothetical protein
MIEVLGPLLNTWFKSFCKMVRGDKTGVDRGERPVVAVVVVVEEEACKE